MRAETSKKILKENRGSYDRMAKEFSNTRSKFWEELVFLKEHTNPDMQVLDIGCGNGRFYPLMKERKANYTGIDNSRGLLDEARGKFLEANFVEGDATALPFPDASFDIAYSFAVVHHIPGRELQNTFFTEAARVLRPGGTLIITAWHLWRPRYLTRLLLQAVRSMLFLSPLEVGDMMHTFGKDKHSRFLHAFTHKGLLRRMKKNGFAIVDSEVVGRASGSGEKNILIIATKRIA